MNRPQLIVITTVDKLKQCPNAISIYRTYHYLPNTISLDSEDTLTTIDGRDITSLVRTSEHGQHYIDEIHSIIQREGPKKFQKLCIWDNPDLQAAGIHYRPPLHIRIIHRYLHTTQKHSQRPVIRAIDKLLKIVLS